VPAIRFIRGLEETLQAFDKSKCWREQAMLQLRYKHDLVELHKREIETTRYVLDFYEEQKDRIMAVQSPYKGL